MSTHQTDELLLGNQAVLVSIKKLEKFEDFIFSIARADCINESGEFSEIQVTAMICIDFLE